MEVLETFIRDCKQVCDKEPKELISGSKLLEFFKVIVIKPSTDDKNKND